MPSPVLQRIEPEHADAINAMILRSKAHWGYGPEFMDKMEAVLRLDLEAAAQGRAIAAWHEGAPVGMAQLSEADPDSEPPEFELDLLFITPDMIGTGLGRVLYLWALEQARLAGASWLNILSDPYARSFYTAMGASFEENLPSQVIPGRLLPRLRHRLNP